jgi:hypothetical protein
VPEFKLSGEEETCPRCGVILEPIEKVGKLHPAEIGFCPICRKTIMDLNVVK